MSTHSTCGPPRRRSSPLPTSTVVAALGLSMNLVACGDGPGAGGAVGAGGAGASGGGAAAGSSGAGGSAGGSAGAGGALDARVAAARATAENPANACAPIQPFYWELGDRGARRASGSVPAHDGDPKYTGSTLMPIASASKWIYGAYIVQLRKGQLTPEDIQFLTFTSGYTSFSRCLQTQSVDECVAFKSNGVHTPADDGFFSYGGGHMEKHASLNGLGPLFNGPLADAIKSQLGTELSLAYSQPQLAGGVYTSADDYAVFLRKILSGELRMRDALGTHAVCTNPATCPQARKTPIPASHSYHYSIGHWVEDDPAQGDGAFNSAGAFGFYPWIDASKTWYGIVARWDMTADADPGDPDAAGRGFASALCGQLIRAAWRDGVAR